jgi:hypothetical protein
MASSLSLMSSFSCILADGDEHRWEGRPYVAPEAPIVPFFSLQIQSLVIW